MTPEGDLVGGTVSYSGRVGHALGCQTAVLTSCQPDYEGLQELADLAVEVIPAANTTTFENIYTENGRSQTIHAVAAPIKVTHLPAKWANPSIVHLGPLANEVDPAIIHQFPNSIIGLTPQGWMRRWMENGRIFAREWPEAELFLPLADVVILSEEDLLNESMLPRYRQVSKLLVLTGNVRGCTVFAKDDVRRIPAPTVVEVEPTGAGDIFAAAFLTHYWQNGRNPWKAAEFANTVAAHSVTQVGLDAKVKHIQKTIQETNYSIT